MGLRREARRCAAAAAPFAIALAFSAAAPAAFEQQQRVTGQPIAGMEFGTSVAIDGDTAAVGVPNTDRGHGAVVVYTRAGDTWTPTGVLLIDAPSDNPEQRLGASVAIDGDTIVAGAPHDEVTGPDPQGAVYTFARTGPEVRNQTARLTASDGVLGDQLGWSVGIDGDTIVAGAPRDDLPAGNPFYQEGSVYTFARSGDAARTETAKLTSSDSDTDGDGTGYSSLLGYSVAIDGDTIVAGAPFGSVIGWEDTVYTFARAGDAARTETAALTGSGAEDESLGYSVDVDGDTIVAGAPFANPVDHHEGAVYTFARNPVADRTETAKLTASVGVGHDRLGESVGIDGATIVAGAPAVDTPGSLYTFARTGAAARNETGELTATGGLADDNLGLSAAIDGDAAIGGAPFDDVTFGGVANEDQGSAVIFSSGSTPPPPGGGSAPAPVAVPIPAGPTGERAAALKRCKKKAKKKDWSKKRRKKCKRRARRLPL